MDLNETMHATPINTISHEKNVLMLLYTSALLEIIGAVKDDRK